jgi:flavin-binding protein dodecin
VERTPSTVTESDSGKERPMSVAKIIEITSTSSVSFDDAVKQGIKRASQTIDDIKSAWIENQQVTVENGAITGYRVAMKITFVLHGSAAD